MKRLLFFVCHMLVSLMLVSVGVAPAGQAIAAPPHGGEYSATGQNEVQGDQPGKCPIDWKPSVLYPVYARSQHFDQNDGAPGPLQVFFPSPNPFSDKSDTSMLNCGQYPLVIFLHGYRPGEPNIYQRWTRLPAALARSGYVVVVPRLPGNSIGQSPWGSNDLNHAKEVLAWMQNEWQYHDQLVRVPGPAIVGHSYGALLGARLAPQIGASAYVSLGARWKEFNAEEWKTLDLLNVPSFFAWGGDTTEFNAQIDFGPNLWDGVKTVKYKWVFTRGLHWDYLSPSELGGEKGPCYLIPNLTADYTALFLSRYVPPAGAGIARLIPPRLLPVPTAARTGLQDFLWSGHLDGLKSLPTAGDICKTFPSVENLPQHVFDRSGDAGAPDSATRPTVAVFPTLGISNIAYRDSSEHLHELWRAPWGTGTTDLTANAGAPNAKGNPFAYADTSRDTEILLYRSSGGTVRSLYWSTGAVGHDNLSGTAGAPGAEGDPVGYYDAATDTHHVIYRDDDDHLHELWSQGVEPIQHGGDLTALAGAPPAEGQPAAFVGSNGINFVIYRGVDGHIHSLSWTTGAVFHEDLSGFAGTPPAKSDPVAYYMPNNDSHQIVYLGDDGHLWELYWHGTGAVVGWDITTLLDAPMAAGTPAAYYSAATNTKHIIYRPDNSSDLHEIVWTPGGWARAHINLTEAYDAPPAKDQPAAFAFQGTNTQHVTYRGTDNHIFEVILR